MFGSIDIKPLTVKVGTFPTPTLNVPGALILVLVPPV